jgi:hypothetical protein
MTILKKAVDERKDFLIDRLIRFGYTKSEDGRQLYELPLVELERLHIEMMWERGKKEQ